MFGNVPLILPFGVLPLILLAAYIVYVRTAESSDKHIGSKRRKGTDEFPLEITALWAGKRAEDLAFTSDGKAVHLTMRPIAEGHLDTPEAVIKELSGALVDCRNHGGERLFEDWLSHCRIHSTQQDPENGHYRVTLSPDDAMVKSQTYIDHEIRNLGRVMMSNSTTNKARYLTSGSISNQCTRSDDGRLLVTINRRQQVPGFLDSRKEITMSGPQITRNLQNRLWNRVEVRCLSLDDTTYHGELVGL